MKLKGDLTKIVLSEDDVYTIANMFEYLLNHKNEIGLCEQCLLSVKNKVDRIKKLKGGL